MGSKLFFQKKPARVGWPRRLALARATPRAEVDVIGAQLCSCARAMFPWLTLCWSDCSLPLIRGYRPQHAHYRVLSRLLPSFSNRWVHLDTVSRQIFGDIQETQFSGSKMEVHVHLKNACPGGIGNRRITFSYNLWFASHPSPHHSPSKKEPTM